ncbi:hypothetical protein Trydic_g7176 [Trypoxylus dichotomus]
MVIRNLEGWSDKREIFRYMATLMRAKFDRNKNVKSFATAQKLLRKGENELFYKTHWNIYKYPCVFFGSICEREIPPPDWAVDNRDRPENVEHATYFAQREVFKKQFAEMWTGQYGNGR